MESIHEFTIDKMSEFDLDEIHPTDPEREIPNAEAVQKYLEEILTMDPKEFLRNEFFRPVLTCMYECYKGEDDKMHAEGFDSFLDTVKDMVARNLGGTPYISCPICFEEFALDGDKGLFWNKAIPGSRFEPIKIDDPVISEAFYKIVSYYRSLIDAMEKQQLEEQAKIVDEVAGNNEILREIICMHLNYMGGVIGNPTAIDGIKFYTVGSNASCNFSLGERNGKRYIHSFDMTNLEPKLPSECLDCEHGHQCDDCDFAYQDILNPPEEEDDEGHIQEVESFKELYLGHR